MEISAGDVFQTAAPIIASQSVEAKPPTLAAGRAPRRHRIMALGRRLAIRPEPSMPRSRRKEIGKCRLCLEEGELSFEHVPPASAFNETRVRRYTMDEWLKTDGTLGRGGRVSQKGIGAYTLCERCNNKTGAWYGREYVQWAKEALYLLACIPSGAQASLRISGRYPLRFLKQAVTMFFSANSIGVAEGSRELARFVLDKHSKSLPPRFNVFLRLYKGPLARSLGLTGILRIGRGHRVESEIAYPPFSLAFSPDSDTESAIGCISHFAQYGYSECHDVTVTTLCGEGHTPLPSDYRTRDQVEAELGNRERKKNKP